MEEYLRRISEFESEEQYNKRKEHAIKQRKIKSVSSFVDLIGIHITPFDYIMRKN